MMMTRKMVWELMIEELRAVIMDEGCYSFEEYDDDFSYGEEQEQALKSKVSARLTCVDMSPETRAELAQEISVFETQHMNIKDFIVFYIARIVECEISMDGFAEDMYDDIDDGWTEGELSSSWGIPTEPRGTLESL